MQTLLQICLKCDFCLKSFKSRRSKFNVRRTHFCIIKLEASNTSIGIMTYFVPREFIFKTIKIFIPEKEKIIFGV